MQGLESTHFRATMEGDVSLVGETCKLRLVGLHFVDILEPASTGFNGVIAIQSDQLEHEDVGRGAVF